MNDKTNPNLTTAEAEALVAEHGSQRKAAMATGISKSSIGRALVRQPSRGIESASIGKEVREPVILGRVDARRAKRYKRPPQGKVLRYVLTCAQNNTRLHEETWLSLRTLAAHYDAQIMVSRFTYDKSAVGTHAAKPGTTEESRGLWYDPRIDEHINDERVTLAPGLVWCGEMNILPTAVRPLSGLEAYTGRDTGVFPHAKIAMESVASGKNEGVKFNFTTGTITQRNYIAKKAGLKAEFHHCYGALLVEVNDAGQWWCRQLNADSDGIVYDLDMKFDGGHLSRSEVEAVSWGDIHVAQMDDAVYAASWGAETGMIDVLRPKHQFMHDLLDFQARNHHSRGNPHVQFRRHVEGTGDVRKEIAAAADFLWLAHRGSCKTVVVDSNHDNALTRWLREADYRHDPLNAVTFLELQLAKYESIQNGRDQHVLEHAVSLYGERPPPSNWRFLREDESYIICPDAKGGIECGMHGHLGANGSRGNARGFAKMGRKAVVGHSHSAGIVDGVYVGGISGRLDQGYNHGPSSWSHSHVVCYPNGKRTVVTIWKGKWRA